MFNLENGCKTQENHVSRGKMDEMEQSKLKDHKTINFIDFNALIQRQRRHDIFEDTPEPLTEE